MRSLTVAAVLLMTVCSVRAGFAGFETGDGIAVTGGVVRVNYMGNKSRTISLGPGVRVRLMEVQITFTNGKTKRHTMLSAGTHTLRAPLPLELVEILGLLCLVALVCGIVAVLSSAFRSRRAEPGAAPNGGPAERLGNSGVGGGRHQ
jgi:hypothetical protein